MDLHFVEAGGFAMIIGFAFLAAGGVGIEAALEKLAEVFGGGCWLFIRSICSSGTRTICGSLFGSDFVGSWKIFAIHWLPF